MDVRRYRVEIGTVFIVKTTTTTTMVVVVYLKKNLSMFDDVLFSLRCFSGVSAWRLM